MVENENIIKEKLKEENQEQERHKTERSLKIFSIIFFIFSIIVLIVLKVNNKDFPLLWMVVIFAIVAIVCGIMYFFFSVFKKYDEDSEEKSKNGLPKAASLSDLRIMSEGALINRYYANHLKKCEEERFFHVGKSRERVYVYKAKMLYSEGTDEGYCYVIINTHLPQELKTILIDPSSSELTKAIHQIAGNPDDDPNTEESTIFNPLTGTTVTTKKIEKPKEVIKKEEKKEDL